jgi:hypothetical protein
MDAETRDAIDSLIGKTPRKRTGGRVYGTTIDPTDYTTRAEAEKARPPRPDRMDYSSYKTAETPRPTYSYNSAEVFSNLKNEVATLSVDTSSASIVLKAPLTEALIKRIENAVPITQREWLPDKRAWRFSPACINILKPILKDEYKDIQMLGVPKALPSTKFDQLMAKLTKDDKALVYRLLASKYHPDKGGSHEVMTLINIVFRGA